MVSNLVVRNAKSGYVTFVAKKRVNGESRTVGYICGLGTMTQEEFKAFQGWAHKLLPQEYRKQMVLATDIAVVEKEEVEGKVAAEAQKKTTVKRAPKQKKVVDEPAKAEKKAEEREKFRREYEKKHGIPKETKKQKEEAIKASKRLEEFKKLNAIKEKEPSVLSGKPMTLRDKTLSEKEAIIEGKLARGIKARKSEASKEWLNDTTGRTMTDIYYDLEKRDRKRLG